MGRTRAGRSRRVCFRFFSRTPEASMGWFPCVLEEGLAAAFLPLQEVLGTLVLLLSQFEEKVAHAFQSHTGMVEIEAPREVCVGHLQVRAAQAFDGDLHLEGIILTNLGAHGWWPVMKLSSKDGVGRFQRLRVLRRWL